MPSENHEFDADSIPCVTEWGSLESGASSERLRRPSLTAATDGIAREYWVVRREVSLEKGREEVKEEIIAEAASLALCVRKTGDSCTGQTGCGYTLTLV
jgi:hypothetical protein